MWDWLMTPIDLSRTHAISDVESWHARTMFFAWAVLSPLAVLVARFFKILPKQNWPLELDSQVWWRFHWMSQSAVLVLSIIGVSLMLRYSSSELNLHSYLGYSVAVFLVFQVLCGNLRGSKGGPTDPSVDGNLNGDHYCMTPWRLAFENIHKFTGYMTLLLAMSTILLGLWNVNAPRWFWLTTVGWWSCLIVAFVYLQRRQYAIDTYQTIWGPDECHPGNRLPSAGWGTHRRKP